jgi:hypothetical protein
VRAPSLTFKLEERGAATAAFLVLLVDEVLLLFAAAPGFLTARTIFSLHFVPDTRHSRLDTLKFLPDSPDDPGSDARIVEFGVFDKAEPSRRAPPGRRSADDRPKPLL